MKRLVGTLVALMLFTCLSVVHAQVPPSSQTSGPQNLSLSPQGLWLAGGANVAGSLKVNAIGTPTAPTVTNVGTAGSTSIAYYCVAEDMNSTGLANGTAVANQGGGDSLPSSATTNTTSNGTLSATNYNTITCGGQAGALGYKVLKTNTSTYLGSCSTNSNYAAGSSTGQPCTVLDTGQATGTYIPNTIDQTNVIANNKVACAGSVTTAAGAITVTAPCASNYSLCECESQNNAAGACSCKVTSTATVISSATVTVGAFALSNAATPSPSPVDNFWGGPQ